MLAVRFETTGLIVEALAMQFTQIAILRYGALGVVFQFVLIAATAVGGKQIKPAGNSTVNIAG